jgi:tripartite-type tricarboxylate transporter receptor subunit TctC
MPDIPTVDEAGLPGLYISTWYGFWAPKGAPKDVVTSLNAAVNEVIAEPEFRKRLIDRGLEAPPPDQHTPEALGALQKAYLYDQNRLCSTAGNSIVISITSSARASRLDQSRCLRCRDASAVGLPIFG